MKSWQKHIEQAESLLNIAEAGRNTEKDQLRIDAALAHIDMAKFLYSTEYPKTNSPFGDVHFTTKVGSDAARGPRGL